MNRFVSPLLCLIAVLAIPSAQAATSIAGAPSARGTPYFWCTNKATLNEANICALAKCRSGASAEGSFAEQMRNCIIECRTRLVGHLPPKRWRHFYRSCNQPANGH
jgi:hypothetical protein